jgi:transcriptional regulator with XRE-family HTH domain
VLNDLGKERLSNLAKDLIGDRLQWDVAEEIGIAQSLLSSWVNKKNCTLSEQTLDKLAAYIGHPPHEVLRWLHGYSDYLGQPPRIDLKSMSIQELSLLSAAVAAELTSRLCQQPPQEQYRTIEVIEGKQVTGKKIAARRA